MSVFLSLKVSAYGPTVCFNTLQVIPNVEESLDITTLRHFPWLASLKLGPCLIQSDIGINGKHLVYSKNRLSSIRRGFPKCTYLLLLII